MRLRVRPQILYGIEAALIGLFFVQALRFLIGMVYSHVSGAIAVSVVPPDSLDPTIPGVIDPAAVTTEVTFLVYMLLLPLVSLLLGRFLPMLAIAGIVTAIGRALMLAQADTNSTLPAALTVGAGLLYIALLIRHRARFMPYFFIFGLALDQLLRATGNTLDPSWFRDSLLVNLRLSESAAIVVTYLTFQFVLSGVVILLSLINVISQQRQMRGQESAVTPDQGLMPIWGGIGMGALLFLQLSLLSLPNAVAARANVDYTTFVPLIMVATLLPLVPWVRAKARSFIALFDGTLRGWMWMLMLALLIVFGTRFPGLGGGIALVVAQFTASMMWWWLSRPRAEKERSFTGLWMLVAVFVFTLLVAADFFTYEYAFVRNFTGNLSFLNPYIPPLLRGFRGMGLGVLLLSVFLGVLPMTQTNRRIPWAEPRTTPFQSLATLGLTILLALGAAFAARPPLVQPVVNVDTFRVGTYNIHAGYSEFFAYDLEAIARTIQLSGANVVMLQEAEAGRLTSFGVDQPLWLARRLGMDRRFYPTNEGLQGLATLSSVPIVYHEGTQLTSVGQQTGVQHVQVSTDGQTAIAFYNTWLGLLLELGGERSIEQQEQDQQRQLTEIFAILTRDYAELSRVRVIIAGTFNNVPGSPLIEQMRLSSGFRDPFAGLPAELSSTLWRTNARARFDYIWTRNLEWFGAGVMDSSASDHRMAVVEIVVNN